MKNKIILSFEVEAEKQAEVMAIGKAISEHIASLKEVGSLVGVEYCLANNDCNAKIQQPIQKPKNNTGSVNNSKSNNEVVGKKSNNGGFIYEAELEASKRYKKNGK